MLEALTLQVKDRLSESHDRDRYTHLLKHVKQSVHNVEEVTAELAGEMQQLDGREVYASVSNARSWQIKVVIDRVNFIELFTIANANANANVNVTCKKKYGKLPEIKVTVFKGDFGEWETFWSSFPTNVDVRDFIERTTKYIYLVQSLRK